MTKVKGSEVFLPVNRWPADWRERYEERYAIMIAEGATVDSAVKMASKSVRDIIIQSIVNGVKE